MTTANNKTHPSLAGTRVGLNPIEEEGVLTVSHDNTWDEKVERGRALVTEINDRKWELGDLANEVAPTSTVGVSNDGLIGKFAEQIGVSANTLREYRRVSAAWSNATRVAFQTWTTHRLLADREDRHEIIAEQVWTYNSLSARLGRLPNPSRISDAAQAGFSTPRAADEVEADAMVEAIRTNPEIAQAAAKALTYADPIAKQEAFQRLSQDAEVIDKPEFADTPNPLPDGTHSADEAEAVRKSRHGVRFAVADAALLAAKRKLDTAINEIRHVTFTPDEKELLMARADDLAGRIGLFRADVSGVENVDWDSALASLTGGED